MKTLLAVMILSALSLGQTTTTLFISGNNTAAVSARKVMQNMQKAKRSTGCENLILVGSANTAVYVLDVVEDNNEGVSATLTEHGEMVWSDTYRSHLLGWGGLFGNSPEAVNFNGQLLVGKLCKAFKNGKIKSLPASAPGPAPEPAVENPADAQQYADCLKLAVDNPSMVCKQEASGASMTEPKATAPSTSQPTADGTIGASSDGNPRVRHDGVTVSQVVAGGPADQIGIKVGDVILAIDGHYLFTIEELNNAIDSCKPGSTIKIRYRRYSMTYETSLIVGNREAAKTEH